jgi:glycosyltransferase involved in cell wall biosynthesis
MNKNILIINTKQSEVAWFEYFKGLRQKGFNLQLLASDQKLLNYFQSKNWEHKSYQAKLKPQKNFINSLIFTLSRPLGFIFSLIQVLFFKFSKKIDTLVCFGFYEKFHFTRAAKLIGLKVIWIISPGEQSSLPKISRNGLTRLSKSATTLCFSQRCKRALGDKKMKIKNIESLKIGVKSKQYLEQKNIFDSLAKNNSVNAHKKFFTIGTIQELHGDISHLEKLFHATRKCLEVIPHIQLIIAGEGEERKKLSWMAKKMNISNLVWFVGNHKHPQKWLSNFDLYISTSPNPKLQDLNTLLLASFNSLAVIAPSNAGFDEFIIHEQSGLLVDIEDSKELANAIIDLQQNQKKRIRLGKNGQKSVINNFQLDKTIQELKCILE